MLTFLYHLIHSGLQIFLASPYRLAVVRGGGAEPLPISEAWGHIADEPDPSSNLEEGIEQTNLRKLPLCQVIVKNPLGQLWLVGKDILHGPRNGR